MAEAMSPSHAMDTKPSLNEARQALTPPTSEEWNKHEDNPTSDDLSELDAEEDDDVGDIEPDHYYEGGRIPVFKPTMEQFRDFRKFIDKIDKYGMKSGIVKVIPPKEWRDNLPALDEAVKTITVKNPITQEISTSGSHGTFTQANIEKQRSYSLPQWKALTEEMQHQPPARRGENRKKQEKPKPLARQAAPVSVDPATGTPLKRKPGRPRKTPLPIIDTKVKKEEDIPQAPLTPTSPSDESRSKRAVSSASSVKQEATVSRKVTKAKPRGRPPKGSQPKSVSERRKYNQRDAVVDIDEAAFEGFDYRFHGNDEFTAERCQELENFYWKSVTYAPPMYGADMPGSLFDERTSEWNVAKLPNLLDVLGEKVPGVNTAYLYLGMWKATFAWHLEDVDLYSINYIHFGAPKQWYSISQEDARRFEKAMQSVWPNDAKHCSQFLRHKTYLISPQLLQSQFNIKVNKLVHYEGEFVITYPYGYHSGYNLGYNCAESVNFANDAWLEYGKIAKKCDCEADSVWINIEDIERKLRGEPTPEYYEETDEDDDMEEDVGDRATKLPSPPVSVKAKQSRKRKREVEKAPEKPARPVKKIKIRIRTSNVEPCVLCPNNLPSEPLLPTDTGRHAHRVCALYTPETYLSDEHGIDRVMGVTNIDKARLDLKCSFCRSKKGACFQCSSKKCTRAYHASCAAAAGVQVDYGSIPVYGDDGTEYTTDAYDFRCRFHRAKRNKNVSTDSLEASGLVRRFCKSLQPKDTIQMQYLGGDIFAGTVVETRLDERTVVVDILPDGDRVEVEWKYVLVLDPADSQLPKPSASAQPLPPHMTSQISNTNNAEFGPPQPGDYFTDASSDNKWAEYSCSSAIKNPMQVKVEVDRENQIWHYLGKNSTEARAQYTEDVTQNRYNPAGNFLDTVKPIVGPPIKPMKARSQSVSTQPGGPPPPSSNEQGFYPPYARPVPQGFGAAHDSARPYQYKPRLSLQSGLDYRSSISTPGSGQLPTLSHAHTISTPLHYPTMPASISSLSRHASMDVGLATPDPLRQRASTLGQNPFSLGISLPQSALQRDVLQDAQKLARVRAMSIGSGLQRNVAGVPLPSLANNPSMSSSESPVVSAASRDLEFVTNIQPYRYLINSYCRRPKVYESPYVSNGGFSNEYRKIIVTNEPVEDASSHYQECVPPSLYPIVPPPASDNPSTYGLSDANTSFSNALPPLQSPWSRSSKPLSSHHLDQPFYSPYSSLQQPRSSSTSFMNPPPYQYQSPSEFSNQLKQNQTAGNATSSYQTTYDRLFEQIKQNAAALHEQERINLPPLRLDGPMADSNGGVVPSATTNIWR